MSIVTAMLLRRAVLTRQELSDEARARHDLGLEHRGEPLVTKRIDSAESHVVDLRPGETVEAWLDRRKREDAA